ncbi:unnamed protein product [Adineta ricciae]|uniref:Uncharacterized protein n=1 Tax=Adineta ricciae TaxID=249248 RepID=A0A813RHB5_ADIRI|nr:unnamed protein product [Adineta ricciae]CAF1276737.1 unnamed protein product [Adineta ricciae]
MENENKKDKLHLTLFEYAERQRLIYIEDEEFVPLSRYIQLKSIKSEWIQMDQTFSSSIESDEEFVTKLNFAANKYHNRVTQRFQQNSIEKSISNTKLLTLEEYAQRKKISREKYQCLDNQRLNKLIENIKQTFSSKQFIQTETFHSINKSFVGQIDLIEL